MKQQCANCRFFRETAATPAQGSTGRCVRYPRPYEPVSREYDCGEWKKRQAWQREAK